MRLAATPLAWPPLRLGLDDRAGPAGRLDPLPRRGAEGGGVPGERLPELALGEDLHGHALARAQPAGPQQLERDLAAGLEAALELGDVHRLGVCAEGLERHRLLHV